MRSILWIASGTRRVAFPFSGAYGLSPTNEATTRPHRKGPSSCSQTRKVQTIRGGCWKPTTRSGRLPRRWGGRSGAPRSLRALSTRRESVAPRLFRAGCGHDAGCSPPRRGAEPPADDDQYVVVRDMAPLSAGRACGGGSDQSAGPRNRRHTRLCGLARPRARAVLRDWPGALKRADASRAGAAAHHAASWVRVASRLLDLCPRGVMPDGRLPAGGPPCSRLARRDRSTGFLRARRPEVHRIEGELLVRGGQPSDGEARFRDD